MKIAIVGCGAVGSALTKAFEQLNINIDKTHGRQPNLSSAKQYDAIFLAVPDHAIDQTSKQVGESLNQATVFFHLAGSLTVEALASAKKLGHYVGVMHPLVSFADKNNPPSFHQTTFVISGDEQAISTATFLTNLLQAKHIVASVHGPTYHAAAALLANGSVSLAYSSVQLLVSLGCAQSDAEKALAGLLHSVAENLSTVGVPAALTGPIRRGDSATIAQHRKALHDINPSFLEIYDETAKQILRCASDAGLSSSDANEIVELLQSQPK